MPRKQLPVKRYTVTLGVTIRKGQGADDMYRALNTLAHSPQAIANLVKAALSETVLRAYRERFKAAEAAMTTMDRLDRASESRRKRSEVPKVDAPRTSDDRRAKLVRRAEEIRDLLGEGRSLSSDLFDELERIANQLEDKTKDAPGPDRRLGKAFIRNVLYRGGRGRELLLEGMADVLSLIAGSKAMRTHYVGDRVVIGIGNLVALEGIKTPSYAEYERGKHTDSLYTVLWRQLEFGTGYYARPDRIKNYWKFGKLPIRGSRGGHFLRDVTGLPYESDAVRFQGVFYDKLVRALSGQ